MKISSIDPTIFFTRLAGGELSQRVEISIENDDQAAPASLEVQVEGRKEHVPLGDVLPGVSRHTIYMPEINHPALFQIPGPCSHWLLMPF